jgi:dTDP-4-amino-4,6-dideoxygalactose transaminase
LVADYTFPATGHAVLHCDAIPVFVDIDPLTYNMDSVDLETKILKYNPKDVKAIIPIHTFGQCADMDKIVSIAGNYNIPVIEDAACAVGSKYKGKSAGSLGDIGCFSFNPAKGTTSGEGGMITTNNKEVADKTRCLRDFGIEASQSSWDRKSNNKFVIPEFSMVGYNYRMSDILAAVGVAQFRKLDKIIAKKQLLARYWDENLKEFSDFITPPFVSDDSFYNYQGYTTLVCDDIDRNALIVALKTKGVGTQLGTYASHMLPIYKCEYSCPVSLDIYNRTLRLPMYYELTTAMIDEIIDIFKEVFYDLLEER